MAETTDVELTDKLRVLSEGLEADGYSLRARWVDAKVQIEIVAGDEACDDCLVPKGVMRGMAATELTSAGVPVSEDEVDVLYPSSGGAS